MYSNVQTLAPAKCGVFWDFDNEADSLNLSIQAMVVNLREFARPHGNMTAFRAYVSVKSGATALKRVSELQSAGVSVYLSDIEDGDATSSDGALIADMIAFAWEHAAPASVIVISRKPGRFQYASSLLRNRSYQVFCETSNAFTLPSQINIDDPQANEKLPGMGATQAETETSVIFTYREETSTPSDAPEPPIPTHISTFSTPIITATRVTPIASPSERPVPHFANWMQAETAFRTLTKILTEYKAKGEPRPLRSKIGERLRGVDPCIYEKAGVKSFKEFAALAAERGLIQLHAGLAGKESMSLVFSGNAGASGSR